MTDLSAEVARVLAERRTACDEGEELDGRYAERRALYDALEQIAGLHVPFECNNLRCSSSTYGLHCAAGCEELVGPDLWPCPSLLAVCKALGIQPEAQ